MVVLSYDGREFFGWQRLRDKPTIQGALEQAIESACGQGVQVQGAGRTDRGAHAQGQVASFRLEGEWDLSQLPQLLNRTLPRSIRIQRAQLVPDSFHARSSAAGKEYHYRIFDGPDMPADLQGLVWKVRERLDDQAMSRALPALVGRHDFATFATRPRFVQKSTVRELRSGSLERSGDLLTMRFEANSFLYHMVRNMVRAVVKVGEGRIEPGQMARILDSRDRSASPGSAPASGLWLIRVCYPDLPDL